MPLHCGEQDPQHAATMVCRLCLHRKRINISTVLAGQKLGIKEVDDGIWTVSFMHYDLEYFDLEQKTLQPLDNPFGPRLSPMSQVRSVTCVSGLDTDVLWRAATDSDDHYVCAISTQGTL
jgi:hypothetical protein